MTRDFFTPEEVNELIPVLEKILPALQRLKHDIDHKGHTLQRAKARAEKAGKPGRGADQFMAREAELEFLVMQARLQIDRIEELGGQLKGFEPGLVDFPGQVDGKPVLLCWREGETHVRYYHGEDEGFAGRKLLPEFAADGGDTPAKPADWPTAFSEFAAPPATDNDDDPAAQPSLPAAAREFLHLFNVVEDYYTAHDVLEEYWRHEDTDDFWKALIQVSVGFVHLGRGNLNGCDILWRRAARYLAGYEPHHYGLNVSALRRRLFADAELVSSDPDCRPGKRIGREAAAAWVERLQYRL